MRINTSPKIQFIVYFLMYCPVSKFGFGLKLIYQKNKNNKTSDLC